MSSGRRVRLLPSNEHSRTLSTSTMAGSYGNSSAAAPYASLDELLAAVRGCRACERHLPLGPRPILQADVAARILIVGHAPGLRAHTTGVPWDDASGARLRDWMGVGSDTFYDASRIAIIPMGYCYPGRANGGDMAPRGECAQLWLDRLLAKLRDVQLTLLIGQYAQRHFLRSRRKRSLTETTKAWREYSPHYFPLPHPSPRNQPWLKRHSWFAQQLLPALRTQLEPLVR